MGIIKAAVGAVGGALADSWLDAIEPAQMGDNTVFVKGVKLRENDRRSSNVRGTDNLVSNGSMIHVYDNQFMMLVDGGKVVDYTAEPGYYKVDDSSTPSLFNGQFGDSLKDAWERIKFGGGTPKKQVVFYINLQEIKGIKFGTHSAVNYFDCFYNAELFLRAHGSYSIKITDPLKFYQEAVPRSAESVDINDINEQYISEFLQALQAAINKMSEDGQRISFLPSKGPELSKHMAETLDVDWKQMRGMEVQSVGIASISYDEESQKLINMRNQGAMMGDPSIREGYVQSAIASGIEAAGSNTAGAGTAFMGMGFGMQASGGAAAAFSQSNQSQMQQSQTATQGTWSCGCGAAVSANAKFCPQCGAKKPDAPAGGFCPECGAKIDPAAKFCPGCGKKLG
ncbi:MAG: SPFH domain-containing protein [Clostridia bacterium]